MSSESTPEQRAVEAAAERAALDELLATLSSSQVRQIASVVLALGAINGGRHNEVAA